MKISINIFKQLTALPLRRLQLLHDDQGQPEHPQSVGQALAQRQNHPAEAGPGKLQKKLPLSAASAAERFEGVRFFRCEQKRL